MRTRQPRILPEMSVELVRRFWSKVALTADTNRCWEWQAATSEPYFDHERGYGSFGLEGLMWRAHRIAYKLFYGHDPGLMHVCHRCDNPPCVNPHHLFLGTPKHNINDCQQKGRKFTPPSVGTQNGRARLQVVDVQAIRQRFTAGETQTSLAAQFGVAQAHISRIVLGTRWQEEV